MLGINKSISELNVIVKHKIKIHYFRIEEHIKTNINLESIKWKAFSQQRKV